MGFFSKLWNLIRGKGYKEEEQEKEIQIEPPQPPKPLETERQIQEKIKEEAYQKTPTTDTKELQKDHKTEYEQMQDKLAKKRTLTALESTIDNRKISTINMEGISQDNISNMYKQLFLRDMKTLAVDKDGNIDNNLLSILLENRQRLQHRFDVYIEAYGYSIDKNGNKKGNDTLLLLITCNGMLLETANRIHDFMPENQKTELKQAYTEFHNALIGNALNITPKYTIDGTQFVMITKINLVGKFT